ncbi:hypothetical protein [Peribacillus frigoritolerans]|uniref:hypothetical protein n=1 Tax=Peribacillus frigoritolerans TaxID=450367 RepID=UPI0024C15E77|nr:hypothetical protein [Peribacillus frigoritolerans]WHX64195.1 hypothetical protein QNH33_11890 [Peribacillus frigoritolerans]
MDDKFMQSMERLLNLKEEYKGKLEFAKETNDNEKIIHYQGACEGLKVAMSAFAPYLNKNY